MEQTLFQAKEVTVFKIPPRAGAGGHKSGEWKVVDKIFTGRLRVMSIGDMCELRLEDPGRCNAPHYWVPFVLSIPKETSFILLWALAPPKPG